jgi:uncharacterized membrane protein YhaH (DUF805 family)
MIMDWVWYLFSFKGRINRAKYWLAGLVIVCWMIFFGIVHFGLIRLLGGSPDINFDLDEIFRLVDPATWRPLTRADIPALIVHGIGTPLFLWVFLATSVKRLHDRDKSGWWMVPFFALPGLYKQFADRLPNSYFLLPVAIAVFVLLVWGGVELYFLKGTRSSNLFGPNPLGKQQARPRSTESRLRATTAYDQTSEIELIPLVGSPPPSMHVKRGHE